MYMFFISMSNKKIISDSAFIRERELAPIREREQANRERQPALKAGEPSAKFVEQNKQHFKNLRELQRRDNFVNHIDDPIAPPHFV